MNWENLKKALYLKLTPKIGNVRAKKIILENQLDKIDWGNLTIHSQVEKMIEGIEQKKINFTTLWDEDYPSLLKEIYDPPPVLFYYGNIFTVNPIAIVGTRKPSRYGERVCIEIVKELVQNACEIISGFAYGIDTIAHQEATRQKGKTIAVLGSGVDIIYPKENHKLYQEILDTGGGIVSEFLPGTQPQAFYFPIRNRIISGLSYSTVVVEASKESGAMITAKTANEQGRVVYTVPGSIFMESFSGNHHLIREGAILVSHPKDILENVLFKPVFSKNISPKIPEKKEEKPIKNKSNLFITEEEGLILSLIEEGGVSLDMLLAKTGMSIAKVLSLLTQLTIKNFIQEQGGLYYKK